MINVSVHLMSWRTLNRTQTLIMGVHRGTWPHVRYGPALVECGPAPLSRSRNLEQVPRP